MKSNAVFFVTVVVVALVAAWAIYEFLLPEFIKEGGPLVILLIALSLMVITFVIERSLAIGKASGKRNTSTFLKDVFAQVHAGNPSAAADLCDRQGGTMASVLGAGLRRYAALQGTTSDRRELTEEVEHAMEEATALEAPALEKNLVALSTIASISTMVGLLGTTIGMIRSFAALANAGAPDTAQLSIGISEALINTAGGLVAAIVAIVAYNVFTTRTDAVMQSTDEAQAGLLHALGLRASGHHRTMARSGRVSEATPGAADDLISA